MASSLIPIGSMVANRYMIRQQLTPGGFGMTYRAIDMSSGGEVALKALPLENQYQVDSVIREFQVIKGLRHNGVVKVYDNFAWGDTAFIVMEFINGESLDKVLMRHGPLSERQTLQYIAEVGSALKAMHDRGLIHRDIKPGNIMISSGHAVLIDFGAAREFGRNRAQTQTAIYTPHFAAPEQMYIGKAQRGPFTDVYALAVTCFDLVTGALPQLDHNGRIKSGSGLSQRVRTALERAVVFEPTRRTRNIPDFARDLGIRLRESPARRTPSIHPLASGGKTLPGRQLIPTGQDSRRRPSFLLFTLAVVSVYGFFWFLLGTMVYRGQSNSGSAKSSINRDAFAAMIVGAVAFLGSLFAVHWVSSLEKLLPSLYSVSNLNSNFAGAYVVSLIAAVFGAWIEHRTSRT